MSDPQSKTQREIHKQHESPVSLFIIFFFFRWVFEQHQGLDSAWHCRRSGNRGGGGRSRLSGSIWEVPEPGRRHHTRPFRLIQVPRQASRSYSRKAHDSGTQLLHFSMSIFKFHIFNARSDLGFCSFTWSIKCDIELL